MTPKPITRVAMIASTIAACAPSVPENPSFQVDVMPILAANCVRCHTYPTRGLAPAHTRWDTYDNIRVDDSDPDREARCTDTPGAANDPNVVCGASFMANVISARVQPGIQPDLLSEAEDYGIMPPRFPLEDWQIDTLVRWAANGAPRGEPRPGNQPPEIAVEVVEKFADRARLAVTISDADHDLVVGELRVRVGTTEEFVGPVRSGHLEIDWDISTIPDTSVPIFARLDDGAGFTNHELGMVDVK